MFGAFNELATLFATSTTLHLICIVYIIAIETRLTYRRRFSSPGNLLLAQNYIASIMYMVLLLVILKHPFGFQHAKLVLSVVVHVKVNQMLGLTLQKSIAVFYPFKLKRLVTRTNTKRFIWLSNLALMVVYGVGALLATYSRNGNQFDRFIITVTATMVAQLSATLLTSVVILVRFSSIKLHQESVNVQQRKQKRRMLCLTSATTLSMCISYVPVMFFGLGFQLVQLHIVFYLYCFDQIIGPLIFIVLAVDHATWWKKLRQRPHNISLSESIDYSINGDKNNIRSKNNNNSKNNSKGFAVNNRAFTGETATKF